MAARKSLIILIVIALFICYSATSFGSGERESNSNTSSLDVQKIEYTGITKVIIENDSIFNIKVTGTADESALYGEIISENLRMFDIENIRTGSELRIEISQRMHLFRRSSEINDIILNVPINTELFLKSETGLVLIENCNGYKELSTETGEICVVNSTGNIHADNETGDLTFGNIIGNIYANSETGSILLYNVSGRLNLNTETGSLEGNLIELTDDSEFNTDTGIINFDLVNNLSDLSYDLDTDTGIIILDTIQSSGEYYSDTGILKIHAETDTGDIIFQ